MKINAEFLASKKDSNIVENGGLALSVSKAKTFDDCKAKYKFCYIERLPRKEWDFHIFGKFSHEVLQFFHERLIENETDNEAKLMDECFNASLENFGSKLKQDAKDEVRVILNKYLKKRETQKKKNTLDTVIAVEKPFYIDLGGSVLLNGFIDRVQVDSDNILHVADYKTTKDKKYMTDFFQLLTYAYVLMLEDKSIENIRASYIMLRHNFQYITKEYNRSEVMEVAEKFLNIASEINEEKLWTPSPKFLCKYCDYVDNCKEGKNFLIKKGLIKVADYGLSEW